MSEYKRPPLIIEVKPTKHKFFVQFDPATGMCLGVSPQKSGECIEIDEYLGSQLQKGTKMLFDYKVELVDDKYTLVSKNAVEVKDNDVTVNTVVENKFVYEIKNNTQDSCIRFKLDKNLQKFTITIDEVLANSLKNSLDLTKENKFDFFTTDQDNISVVDRIIQLNMNELLTKQKLEIDYVAKFVPRLFCRKLYNYSYEVENGF